MIILSQPFLPLSLTTRQPELERTSSLLAAGLLCRGIADSSFAARCKNITINDYRRFAAPGSVAPAGLCRVRSKRPYEGSAPTPPELLFSAVRATFSLPQNNLSAY